MKNASWPLALAFAGLLVFAFVQVPPLGPQSALSIHVESRYQQDCLSETGIGSPTLAVLTDYRSFDLWAITLLFICAAFSLFLFSPQTSRSFSLLAPLLCLGVGALLVLGIGFLSLRHGANFLDYEGLAFWLNPGQARPEGAFLLLLGAALALAGLLMLWIHWFRQGGFHGGR